MASTVTVTKTEEVRIGNCPNYDETTLIESNQETYLVGEYNNGTVDVRPLTEPVEVDSKYDYVAAEPMTFSAAAVGELVDFLTP